MNQLHEIWFSYIAFHTHKYIHTTSSTETHELPKASYFIFSVFLFIFLSICYMLSLINIIAKGDKLTI